VDNELEVIRHQMEETRSSLADKLETLEHEVLETVQGATSAVSGTVEAVKETVQDAVETVRDAFDLRKQVERHPWPTLLGAVATGYLAGHMLLPERSNKERALPPSPAPPIPAAPPAPAAPVRRAEAAPSPLAPALERLKGLAIGSLMALARRFVTRAMPESLAPELTRVVDELTTRLGGKVVEWPEAEEPDGAAEEAAQPVERTAAPRTSSGEAPEPPAPRPNGRTGKRRRARS
jgi:hypothetical protein